MIDTHEHHWELGRFRYPWLDDPEFAALRTDYLPADYRADVHGVSVEGWCTSRPRSIMTAMPSRRRRG